MKLNVFSHDAKGWSTQPFPDLDSDQSLVVVFGSSETIDSPGAIKQLAAAYPKSHVVGCSSSGEIFGTEVSDGSLSVAVARFERGRLRTASSAVESAETSFAAGESLAKELATDDELKELQAELIAKPEKGDIIRGTGGIRKVRMAVGNKGKSGSVRVLYILAHADKIFLILAYPKSAKESLTNEEKAKLKHLVQSLKGEGK